MSSEEKIVDRRELPNAQMHGSGSVSSYGYKVEVRTSYYKPIVLDNFVIDGVWRVIPIKRGMTPWGINIPISPLKCDMADHGLLPYEAAQAHRWAFLAILDARNPAGTTCIETRLVKVKYSYTYTTEEIGVSACQDGMSFKRDWEPFYPRFPTESTEVSE